MKRMQMTGTEEITFKVTHEGGYLTEIKNVDMFITKGILLLVNKNSRWAPTRI
jgi:hypothetical protein